nr:hypothetical protein [Tanacetum cinerariifolium]
MRHLNMSLEKLDDVRRKKLSEIIGVSRGSSSTVARHGIMKQRLRRGRIAEIIIVMSWMIDWYQLMMRWVFINQIQAIGIRLKHRNRFASPTQREFQSEEGNSSP